MSTTPSLLSAASSLVLLQALTRILTFVLNQCLVRLASPEVFGTATIQFELLLSTILFLSREGIRNALLRTDEAHGGDNKDKNQLVTNISVLPITIGIPVTCFATLFYLVTTNDLTKSQPHFHLALTLYCLSAGIELLSEPLYIRAINQLRLGVRVRAEGAAVVAKSVGTVGLMIYLGSKWSLVAFSGGQLMYAITVLGVYLREYWSVGVVVMPRKVHGKEGESSYFDPHLLRLSGAMTAQSFVKHLLTEGDKMIISQVSPLKDQGGYAVASNYGSMIARIVFQPIEETSRIFFSKSLAGAPPDKPSTPSSIQHASSLLTTLMLFYTHLTMLFLAFGPPYIPALLSLLLPRRYLATSAPQVLKAYCVYLPVMGFNGFLEAFVSSTAEEKDLRRQSQWMIVFSVVFALSGWGFMKVLGLGEVGLVWANAVNLGCRAIYGMIFVLQYFQARATKVSVRSSIPPFAVLAAFAISAGVVRWSEEQFGLHAKLKHVVVGGTFFLFSAIVTVLTEKQALIDLLSVVRRRGGNDSVPHAKQS